MYPKINKPINNIRLCVNDQILTDTYTQRHMKNTTRKKIIIGRKRTSWKIMFGDDGISKSRKPEVSLIDFLGDRYKNTRYPPKN